MVSQLPNNDPNASPPDYLPPSLSDQRQQLYAGANPLLQNTPDVHGIISLDKNSISDAPSSALLSIVAQKAGCTVDELKNKNLDIQKGFRPEKNSNEPIPIFAYSNPPGPDCYYLVRHWRVTVQDAQGQPMELHFTKKIYTSVQVPKNLDGTEHKQQQYIAALAARTYAKIEESRMEKDGKGIENELYKSVGSQMAKIAHERFVTMEMFNNAKNVTINPSKKNKISDTAVDNIQLRFRISTTTPKGERKLEQFHTIPLQAATALELKQKTYRFQGENSSSAHVRTVAASLNREAALNLIKGGDMTPEEAFAEVGLTINEAQAAITSDKMGKNQEFYNDLAYFSDRKSLSSLMTNHTGANYQLSPGMLDKIATEKSFLQKMNLQKTRPENLAPLTKLKTLLEGAPTASELQDAKQLLEATRNVYYKMNASNKAITKLEKEQKTIGMEIAVEPKMDRNAILNKMADLFNEINNLISNDNTTIIDNDGVESTDKIATNNHKVDIDDNAAVNSDQEPE